MTKQLKVATRRELIEAVAKRYQASTRFEKRQILNELITVTGFHRKHALRTLQRRVKHWRSAVAQRLVFGDGAAEAVAPVLIGGVSRTTGAATA
jgi:hypothetical protein